MSREEDSVEDSGFSCVVTENRKVMLQSLRVASLALEFAESVLRKIHQRNGPVVLPAPEAKMVELALDAFKAANTATARQGMLAHDITHDINVVVSQEVESTEPDEN